MGLIGIEDKVIESVAGSLVTLCEDMGIDVEGGRGLGVAQPFGDCHDIHPFGDQQRGHRVTEHMRVDVREAMPLGKLGEKVCDAVRVHQLPVLVGGYVGRGLIAQHTAVGGLFCFPYLQ